MASRQITGDVLTDPTELRAHHDALYRFAILNVRNPTEAEDLVQATFLAALQARRQAMLAPQLAPPPPQPERASRTPRMPRIEDLPIPAQNEIRAQRGETTEDSPEKRRMSLLQRLAQVGLGRREEPAAVQQPSHSQLPPLPQRPPIRGPEPVSEYAKRTPAPAPQGLDIHGRAVPVHKPVDDDQLEIPAFLRRQAN